MNRRTVRGRAWRPAQGRCSAGRGRIGEPWSSGVASRTASACGLRWIDGLPFCLPLLTTSGLQREADYSHRPTCLLKCLLVCLLGVLFPIGFALLVSTPTSSSSSSSFAFYSARPSSTHSFLLFRPTLGPPFLILLFVVLFALFCVVFVVVILLLHLPPALSPRRRPLPASPSPSTSPSGPRG